MGAFIDHLHKPLIIGLSQHVSLLNWHSELKLRNTVNKNIKKEIHDHNKASLSQYTTLQALKLEQSRMKALRKRLLCL
jgi:hypothetical protein